MTDEVPGQWQSWEPLPDALTCDQCDEPFEVGADVWVVKADMPVEAVTYICRPCAERFISRIQQKDPEVIPSIASKMGLKLYRPERELTLDEITTLEVATKLLKGEGGRLIALRPTLH